MNIVVIVLDSLRADHLGCYGSNVKTPNIDALAEESALFENAYSENLPTLPCRTAWWTGRHLFTRRGWQPFETDDILLAEVLSVHGFTSALITDTYHMHGQGYNCGRGFDTTSFIRGQEYDPWIIDPGVSVDLGKFHRLRGDESDELWKPRFAQYLRNASTFKVEEDHCVARVMWEATRWLEHVTASQRDNIFLWVDSFSPHEPWDPPARYRRMYDPDYTGQELIDPVPGAADGYMTKAEVNHTRGLYAGVVTLADKWVGILLDSLRTSGLYENSLIMITSDHGEPFGEHGFIRKARPECHEQLVRIPWVVRHPNRVGAGQRFQTFAQPPDLMPTILDAAGFDLDRPTVNWGASGTGSANLHFTGTSLLPVLAGEAESVRDFAVSAYYNQQWSIRTNEWSFLLPLNDRTAPQLYNRKTDRAELQNVLEDNRDIARDMEARVRGFADGLKDDTT